LGAAGLAIDVPEDVTPLLVQVTESPVLPEIGIHDRRQKDPAGLVFALAMNLQRAKCCRIALREGWLNNRPKGNAWLAADRRRQAEYAFRLIGLGRQQPLGYILNSLPAGEDRIAKWPAFWGQLALLE